MLRFTRLTWLRPTKLILFVHLMSFPLSAQDNPLSPLSDPSNGTPKRPTPKANS